MSAVLAKLPVAFTECQQCLPAMPGAPAVLLSRCCLSTHPFRATARAGWVLVIFCVMDVALACLICSCLCFGQQKSLFSIPAGTNVTVLVPSEAAIKNLSKPEKDFWLTPYMLPFLVRCEKAPAFALLYSNWLVSGRFSVCTRPINSYLEINIEERLNMWQAKNFLDI